jgi:lysine-arginine-ornithine-binding protein
VKRLVWIIAASAAAVAVVAAAAVYFATQRRADPNVVRIATDGAFPPFSYVDAEGALQGFDVDIAQALCETMRVECPIVARDMSAIVAGLLDGEYDAIVASMPITAERKKMVTFTKTYRDMPARFVQRKGAGLDVGGQGFAGKAIGVQAATIHEIFARASFGEAAEVKAYTTLAEAILDLASGRLDAIFADGVALGEGFLKTDAGGDFEFVGPGFADPKWFGDGAGIAIRHDDGALLRALNKAIDTIRADGTYQRIQEKYFAYELYGGPF